MYYTIYAELNLLCAAILFYMLYKLSSADRSAEMRAFASVIASTFVILLLDTAWSFVEPRTDLIFLNYAINSFYFFDSGLICYFWYVYIELKLKNWRILQRKTMALLAMPLVLLGVLCAATPFSNWLFYIDAGNAYHRGNLYFIQYTVSYGYIAAASYQVCRKLKNAADKWEQSVYLTLLSFFVFPIAGSVLSIMFYGLPAVWAATTLSLLMVFINMQSYQISVDQLTGLNNRRSFDRYLAELLRDGQPFCLLMLDVDKFKGINDVYGHVEGDRALRKTALLLKDICGGEGVFLARFGGDEFAVLVKNGGTETARKLTADIDRTFEAAQKVGRDNFSLAISCGFAESWPGCTAEQLTAAADKKLYEEKRRLWPQRVKR